MFESAELGHKIDKETYKSEVTALREALLDAQYDLAETRKFPVIILIGGVDGAGKGETANLLNEWMDPRHIHTYAFGQPTDEEIERPHMWRYWRSLPPKGKIGIYFGSWYTEPIVKRAYGEIKNEGLTKALDEVVRFEKMLTDEGTLVLKFWFHLSKAAQKKCFDKLESDPHTRWRVTDLDRKHLKMYDEFREISEHVLRETSTAAAPWIIVEGTDGNYRNLTVGKQVLEAIRRRIDHPDALPKDASAPPLISPVDNMNILKLLDLSKKIDKKQYSEQLEDLQGRLNQLTRDPRFSKMSVLCVFEGSDAAGKGGSIRRITQAIDARVSASRRLPRQPRKNEHNPTCGDFGATSPDTGEFRFSTAPGTVACWSSASRDFVRNTTGCGLTAKSMTLKNRSRARTMLSSNSGCKSARKNNCVASKNASRSRSNASRSPTRIGATGRNGTPMKWLCAT